MQTCNLVSMTQLQPKLTELVPIAKKAIRLESFTNSEAVKLTCLRLFRKILTDKSYHGKHSPAHA